MQENIMKRENYIQLHLNHLKHYVPTELKEYKENIKTWKKVLLMYPQVNY